MPTAILWLETKERSTDPCDIVVAGSDLTIFDCTTSDKPSETLVKIKYQKKEDDGEDTGRLMRCTGSPVALVFENDHIHPAMLVDPDATGDFAVHAVGQASKFMGFDV